MIFRNINSTDIELFIQLVNLYVKTVELFSSRLSSVLQIERLSDWRSEGVPIQGELDEGWSYAFHGSGCKINSKEIEIDFEFNAECQVGSFDVWRLWSFVCDNEKVLEAFSVFSNKNYLQKYFDTAVKNKLIKKDGDLYRLVGEFKNTNN